MINRRTMGQHAVVLGGSIAGLVTARVLADHFDQVTLIERDRLPRGPEPRRGVPQARHFHLLLERGRRILEHLFPGLTADLASYGAPTIDVLADLAWFSPAGWATRFPSGICTVACTRDLLEWCVRQHLAANPRVHFHDEHEVVGLLAGPAGSVRGVQVRGATGVAFSEGLQAALVVDTTGRASHAPQWLQALAYPAPAETIVNAFVGYATRLYARPTTRQLPWQGLAIQSMPPTMLRAGVIFPAQSDCWIVTLWGIGRDYPPTNEAGFLEFARSLRDPLLYDTIRDLQPLSPIFGTRGTENRLRHYERLSRQPGNFVVLGDAVAALNPIYGQGMTVAALGALALGRSLQEQRRHPDDAQLAGRFQRHLAKTIQPFWLMATSEDFRSPVVTGGRRNVLTWAAHRYLDQVIRKATDHEDIHRRLFEVIHAIKPTTSLLAPSIVISTLL